MAEQTKKRQINTDDETWEVRSQNTPAITNYRGAAKENEMKIFEMITLNTNLAEKVRETGSHSLKQSMDSFQH